MKINKEKEVKQNMNRQTNCDELQKQIGILVETIDRVEDEKLVLENQLKKALADYQNLSNGMDKRIQIRSFQVKKGLCEELIPSLDSMMLAIQASESIKLDDSGKAWLQGINATLESMTSALDNIGLKQYIPEVGSAFDSNLHEVIATSEGENKGCISQVIQPGYVLDGTVIRHSRVIVVK